MLAYWSSPFGCDVKFPNYEVVILMITYRKCHSDEHITYISLQTKASIPMKKDQLESSLRNNIFLVTTVPTQSLTAALWQNQDNILLYS